MLTQTVKHGKKGQKKPLPPSLHLFPVVCLKWRLCSAVLLRYQETQYLPDGRRPDATQYRVLINSFMLSNTIYASVFLSFVSKRDKKFTLMLLLMPFDLHHDMKEGNKE